MVYHSAPSSPFLRRFVVRRHLTDVGRLLGLALHLRRYVSRPVESGPASLRFAPDAGATLLVRAVGPHVCEVYVACDASYGSRFGLLVDAVRSVGRVREERSPARPAAPAVSARPRRRALPAADSYEELVRWLGLPCKVAIGGLHVFLHILEQGLGGRLAVPACVMRQARDCAFVRPLELAAIVAEILRIHAVGPQRASDLATFGHLPGFRLNLSDTQLQRYRSDYAVRVDGVEHVGRLHCTLGSGFSPSTCASVHWVCEESRVILTRIGAHGRNAQS